MNIIYWSHRIMDTPEHPHYGKHCAIAISPTDFGLCHLFTGGENGHTHDVFDTEKEAIQNILEFKKPEYYETFDLDYELRYIDPKSKKMGEIMEVLELFISNLHNVDSFLNRPWWKRLFRKPKWETKVIGDFA